MAKLTNDGVSVGRTLRSSRWVQTEPTPTPEELRFDPDATSTGQAGWGVARFSEDEYVVLVDGDIEATFTDEDTARAFYDEYVDGSEGEPEV